MTEITINTTEDEDRKLHFLNEVFSLSNEKILKLGVALVFSSLEAVTQPGFKNAVKKIESFRVSKPKKRTDTDKLFGR